MEVGLFHYNVLSAILFCVGIFGILFNRKSVIGVLIAIEIIFLAANINFVAFSAFLQDITGQVFSLFVLGVAAAEIGVGLAILVIYFKNKSNIQVEEVNTIKD